MFVVIGPVWAKCFVGLAFVAFSRDGFLSSKRDDWLFVNLPIFTQFGRAAHVNQRPLDMYRKVFSKMLHVGVIYPQNFTIEGQVPYTDQPTAQGTHCKEIVYSTLQSTPRAMQFLRSN